jgi:Fe-S-cluster containining protein
MSSKLDTILKYINNYRKKADIIKILPSKFTCSNCASSCCDAKVTDYGVQVFPQDLKEWISDTMKVVIISKEGFQSMKSECLLSSLYLTAMKTHNNPCICIDRKQDYLNKLKYHSDLYKYTMEAINPSLLLITDTQGLECVFLGSDKKCTVHDYAPLTCRMYPYRCYRDEATGALIADVEKKHCPKSAFTKGEFKVDDQIKDFYANEHSIYIFSHSKLSAEKPVNKGKNSMVVHGTSKALFEWYQELLDEILNLHIRDMYIM